MKLIGNLIIAPPAVEGNFWEETVCMITEHHGSGSIGIVLNKQSSVSLIELGEQLEVDLDLPGYVYIGGPISQKSLSIIHSPEWISKNTMRINDEFSLSSADDIIPRFSTGDLPEKWRLFVGMCGWRPGQLYDEIKGNPPYHHETSWCTAPSNYDAVFKKSGTEQWIECLEYAAEDFAKNILKPK